MEFKLGGGDKGNREEIEDMLNKPELLASLLVFYGLSSERSGNRGLGTMLGGGVNLEAESAREADTYKRLLAITKQGGHKVGG